VSDYERVALDGDLAWGNDPMPDEPITELGYAHRLITAYGDRLRYVPTWRKWLVWDGMRWARDDDLQAVRWMTLVVRSVTTAAVASSDRMREKEARRVESNKAVHGALNLASAQARVAVKVEHLDADPFLLNCRNGVLDLRTGQLCGHDPDRLLTKLTGAEYDAEASGLEFPKFLERVQPDPDMRSFLARLLGHSLEGRVTEHLMPIFYGEGGNGKGTLVGVVLAALGDYANSADADLLTARSFDAHPTGVADLFGLRLALLSESDRGRHLAEGTMKRLTGGDRVKARRMREDFWSFDPSHTFLMLTNHKPIVTGTDEGVWRRLRLVPFEETIADQERDLELGERLKLEVNAVLAWLVAGYQQWREVGLAEPSQVIAATDAYRAESDLLGRFLDERCLLGAGFHVRSSELYAVWQTWCAAEGEHPGTQKSFTTALQNKGFDTERTRVGIKWRGIGLAADDGER
jgi:putative DNA primase/helicase